MGKTKIQWTDMSWPVVTGCSHAGSPGCDSCYAARMAATRLRHHPRYEGLATIENSKARWTGEIRLNRDVLDRPLRWRKPRMVFVASMGDLFHSDVPFMFVSSIWRIMASHQRHAFQILTKRPRRMLEFLNTHWRTWVYTPKVVPMNYCNKITLPNVWLGVSVENQATADERIPWLLQISAAVRFVSCEPLLEPIDLGIEWGQGVGDLALDTTLRRSHLDWIIVGGESGPGARPMHPGWARSLRDQCQAAGVPFFFKQWGAWLPLSHFADAGQWKHQWPEGYRYRLLDGSLSIRVGKKRAGHLLDGRVWDEFPVSK